MQVTLKSLQIEQEHHAALEVDRYAEVLLSELGVTERGLHSLALWQESKPQGRGLGLLVLRS